MERRYLYAFEGVPDDLPRPPMSAVRALHVTGMQIGPRGWSALSPDVRQALCIEGTREEISQPTVRALIASVPLEHLRLVHRVADVTPGDPAPKAFAHLGGVGSKMAAAWPSLPPLERYMLRALSSNQRLFEKAASEIAGGMSPGNAPWRGVVARAELTLSQAALERLCGFAFLEGQAFLLARTAGVRAARVAPDLFDLAASTAIGVVELDWLVQRTGGLAVLWQAHASTWEGELSPIASMMGATAAAIALRDMVRDIGPEAAVRQAIVQEEIWVVGSGSFADEATGFFEG